MPTLANEINIDALFCMFKGEAGLRKSTAALSFPKPMYFFDWDKKMRGILTPMVKWNVDPNEVSYDSYIDWDKAKAKLERLQIDCPFKTIVIDSVTSCADGILYQGKKLKTGTDKGKKVNNIQVNSIEDYGAEDAALSEMVAILKDIHEHFKVNVILIAHVMEVSKPDAKGETVTSRTIVTAGKRVSIKIPAYCEEVYHFNIEKSVDPSIGGNYTVLTQHTGDDFARTSLPLPKVINMGDKELYKEWVAPGIIKLREDVKLQAEQRKLKLTQGQK